MGGDESRYLYHFISKENDFDFKHKNKSSYTKKIRRKSQEKKDFNINNNDIKHILVDLTKPKKPEKEQKNSVILSIGNKFEIKYKKEPIIKEDTFIEINDLQ